MAAEPAPVDTRSTSRPPNECQHCGHLTDFRQTTGFQCDPGLYALLLRICTLEEMNKLRLDPAQFIGLVNRKLGTDARFRLQADLTTDPPTLQRHISIAPE